MEEDVKIAPREISKALKQKSAPESDTVLDYLFQKRSGNIRKAHHLGKELAEQCVDCTGDHQLVSDEKLIALSTFCIVDVIKANIKDSILSNTITATFYDTIEELDPRSWDYLTESGDISLYNYGGKDSVGETFSTMLAGEIEEDLVLKGERLYSHWETVVRSMIQEKRFLA